MKDPEAALLGSLGHVSKSGGSESSSLSVVERGGGVRGRMQRVLGAPRSLGWPEDTALGRDVETRASIRDLTSFSAPFADPAYLQALKFLSILSSATDIFRCHSTSMHHKSLSYVSRPSFSLNSDLQSQLFPQDFPLNNQFSSVTRWCLTLCDPMDCSMPGLPVHH